MNQALNDNHLRAVAPSIFAAEPWEKNSSRYAFIPTIRIVEQLRQNGFVPVSAKQSASRIPGKGMFTKHMIRFRQAQEMLTAQVSDEIPEIVLVNSHDRSSSYSLSAGVFRVVCSNGMIVKSSDMGTIRINHTGNIVDRVIEGSYEIVRELPRIMDNVQRYKDTRLTANEVFAYAEAALELRHPTPVDEATGFVEPSYVPPVSASALLTVRRNEDRETDLWTVSNCVQENLMRGGLRSVSANGRRSRTRGINSVTEELRVNRALWMLTEKMAALKAA